MRENDLLFTDGFLGWKDEAKEDEIETDICAFNSIETKGKKNKIVKK